MNEFIKIGRFVNTHGIKGEIRLLSDFELKKQVFVPNFTIYLGKDYQEFQITTYRIHKNFDLLKFVGIDNINQILKLKGASVYIKRNDLKLKPTDYLINDLINFSVYEGDELIGKITDIVYNKTNILLAVDGLKKFYIPYHGQYLHQVELASQKVIVKGAKELII